MRSKLLQINNEKWIVSIIGEQALILQPESKVVPISKIHKVTRLFEKANIDHVIDVVPAYESLALIYDRLLDDIEKEIARINNGIKDLSEERISTKKVEIPVCYDLGLDWSVVEEYTGLPREKVIKKHTSGVYTIAMLGFIPGFLYMSGLDDEIACPRREDPRTKIPAGSVGIGGNQTGVYSLVSPGGWQIIGRTPLSFFDALKNPPTDVEPGDEVTFIQISENEFSTLEEK
jgi:KipI family sensor histidine kinase inhibitor